MKRVSITVAEILQIFSFLLYLFGSSLTLIEHGAELSLWIMTFAIAISAATTILPWLGIRWLQLEKKGCQAGRWVALLVQIASWGVISYAMLLRLERDLPRFYTLTTLLTLLWASWLLIYLYSRHACRPNPADDTLIENKQSPSTPTKNSEER